MAKFCNQCGRPLKEGEVCTCKSGQNQASNQSRQDYRSDQESQAYRSNEAYEQNYDKDQFREKNIKDDINYWQGKFQDRLGESFKEKVDNFQSFSQDSYGDSPGIIIPGIIAQAEGEIPVKQYDLATFKNMLFGFITYDRSSCKLLVTNKRVLLYNKGRDLNGETRFQQEFSISEIAGVKISKIFSPNVFRLISGLIISLLVNTILTGLVMSIFKSGISFAGVIILALGIIATIMIKDNNFLSLIAASSMLTGSALVAGGKILSFISGSSYLSGGSPFSFINAVFGFLSLILFFYTLFRIWLFGQMPSLAISIDTKASLPAMTMFSQLGIQSLHQGSLAAS